GIGYSPLVCGHGVCCVSMLLLSAWLCGRPPCCGRERGARGTRRPHCARPAACPSCPPCGTRHPGGGAAPAPNERAASGALPPAARRCPRGPCPPGLLSRPSTSCGRCARAKTPTTAACRQPGATPGQPGPRQVVWEPTATGPRLPVGCACQTSPEHPLPQCEVKPIFPPQFGPVRRGTAGKRRSAGASDSWEAWGDRPRRIPADSAGLRLAVVTQSGWHTTPPPASR